MKDLEQPRDALVDVVFPIVGHSLARDHAQALAQALRGVLPWLGTEPRVGIHPVKVVPGNEAQALLSNRTRLLLRVPATRVAVLSTLAGHTLDVGSNELRLGTPHVRELLPHATLYAYSVAAASSDELAFMRVVASELEALNIRGQRVCGKHGSIAACGRAIDSFSLMLHGLSPEHSLRLQYHGVGSHRLLGCGVFVPHKSAAAVGAEVSWR